MKLKKPIISIIAIGAVYFVFSLGFVGYVNLENTENSNFWKIIHLDNTMISKTYAESGQESGRESGEYYNEKEQKQVVAPLYSYYTGNVSYSENGNMHNYGIELEIISKKVVSWALVDYPSLDDNFLSQRDIERALTHVVSQQDYNIYEILGDNRDSLYMQKALDRALLKGGIENRFDINSVLKQQETVIKQEEQRKQIKIQMKQAMIFLDKKLDEKYKNNHAKKRYVINKVISLLEERRMQLSGRGNDFELRMTFEMLIELLQEKYDYYTLLSERSIAEIQEKEIIPPVTVIKTAPSSVVKKIVEKKVKIAPLSAIEPKIIIVSKPTPKPKVITSPKIDTSTSAS